MPGQNAIASMLYRMPALKRFNHTEYKEQSIYTIRYERSASGAILFFAGLFSSPLH
jgi:hypothetical protein